MEAEKETEKETAPAPGALRTDAPTINRFARRAFLVLFAIGFLNYLDRSILIGAADVVAHELRLGLNSIGFIASAFLIVYTLGTIPMGIWADHSLRKNCRPRCLSSSGALPPPSPRSRSTFSLLSSRA